MCCSFISGDLSLREGRRKSSNFVVDPSCAEIWGSPLGAERSLSQAPLFGRRLTDRTCPRFELPAGQGGGRRGPFALPLALHTCARCCKAQSYGFVVCCKGG